MKKLFLIAACLTLVSGYAASNHSHSRTCPYTDNFYISKLSGTPITIRSLKSDGSVAVQQESPALFFASCANNADTYSGNIYLTVANTSGGSCKLTILDGPFVMDPTVTATNCQGGLQFNGIDHSYGTFDYTLKFGQGQSS